ncbi:MAG: hypothetical protein EBS56_03650, partial [Planctomycetia bacterium]|nr:hypothetical protein [Planctomycetia bacterium]
MGSTNHRGAPTVRTATTGPAAKHRTETVTSRDAKAASRGPRETSLPVRTGRVVAGAVVAVAAAADAVAARMALRCDSMNPPCTMAAPRPRRSTTSPKNGHRRRRLNRMSARSTRRAARGDGAAAGAAGVA